MFTTEDIYTFDDCHRKFAWSSFEPPRISIATALNESLRIGLLSGDPLAAKNHLMQRAAEPGFNLWAIDVYSIAVHHANLIELITHYLLAGDGPWKAAEGVTVDSHPFTPLSYLLPDNRLRRVILCSKWDSLRQQEEVTSWRTIADIISTGRPMLLNAISIGSAIKGFRPSPWTRAYEHPVARHLRIQPSSADNRVKDFNSNWRRIYRESTSKSCAEWLQLMQADKAFDDIVHSVNVEVPPDGQAIYAQMSKMMDSMSQIEPNGEMRRSSCYKIIPCIYSPCCHHSTPTTPSLMGWKQKDPR